MILDCFLPNGSNYMCHDDQSTIQILVNIFKINTQILPDFNSIIRNTRIQCDGNKETMDDYPCRKNTIFHFL
jgi:hypothetical protein